MPEPISAILLAGAAGGGAGKLIEKAWDSGEKWLTTFLVNHQLESQQAARENAEAFLNDLAARLDKLEQKNPYSKEFFSDAFKQPSFSVLLQKAIINSAQTKSAQKHTLLSKLVAEKLQSKEESTLSLASQMACDAIAFANFNQLQLLGLQCALVVRHPRFNLPDGTEREQFLATCEYHFRTIIKPFVENTFNIYDILHLEALSCLKHTNSAQMDLNASLRNWGPSPCPFTKDDLFRFPLGLSVKELWEERGLQHIVLTTVGMLVGSYVIDTTTQTDMDMSGFGGQ